MTQNRPPKLPDSTDNRDDLLQRLLDCKCALVRGSKSMPRPVLLPFTMKMLSWHDNPRAGCYTAINDIVYDITTYLEMHPGGKNILINSLGRVTDNFYEHHDQELLDFYPEWRIGRLVAEMRLDQLRKHQIAIHESVFDISGLAPDKTNNKMHQWIYACVSAFGGTDASETITQREQSNVRDALLQLYTQQKERIVGHVVRDGDEKLKEIPDGELVNRLNARKVQGAWTVVDGLVYDVTREYPTVLPCTTVSHANAY
ncbi:hypothetical protein BJ170DRAFT_364673 [Xylariales sp. AK1849]|nr:hypothetical protein BJ170DRAFT_364673 [Xylariales sp. AK1849]